MSVDAKIRAARVAREENIDLEFGTAFADLEEFTEGKAPSVVKLEVASMLNTLASKLVKADWKGDEGSMLAAFSGGIVHVGSAQLSDTALAALDSAIASLAPAGTDREKFLASLALNAATTSNALAALDAENTSLKASVKDLTDEVKTGGELTDPDSWASKADDGKKAVARAKVFEDALFKACNVFGVDPSGKSPNDIAREMASIKAALAVVATPDPAAIKAAGDKGALAVKTAVRPYFDWLESHKDTAVGAQIGKTTLGKVFETVPEPVRKAATDAVK